jgi:hypothetical protein
MADLWIWRSRGHAANLGRSERSDCRALRTEPLQSEDAAVLHHPCIALLLLLSACASTEATCLSSLPDAGRPPALEASPDSGVEPACLLSLRSQKEPLSLSTPTWKTVSEAPSLVS